MWDVDGNDYVDFLLGQGPNFLGHGHPDIHAAVVEATRQGMVFGAEHPSEVEAAEAFLAATRWPERVRFGVSGTEVVQAALRVARAATDRTLVVRFAGHYHGWLDDLLTTYDESCEPRPGSAGQVVSRMADSVVVPWNDAQGLARVLESHRGAIAAVLMEPIMLNQGSILPRPGYLESVRALCDAHGAVLIFDEVITGFRVGLGGAAERLGVTPDLAVYGKAVAGGWPVSALAGRADLLEPVGTGAINVSGTFNGSVMAMAAVTATMKILSSGDPYAALESIGSATIGIVRERAAAHGLPLHLQGLPQAFHASWGARDGDLADYRDVVSQDSARYAAVADALVRAGVWVSARGIWFLSLAHDQSAVDAAAERIDRAFAEVAKQLR